MRRAGRMAVTAVSAVLVWSCSDDDASPPRTTTAAAPGSPSTSSTSVPAQMTTVMEVLSGVPSDFADDPPEVTLRSDGEAIVLGPHSHSNNEMAADGTSIPPEGPAVVVDTAEVIIEYPLRGWSLVAQATSPGGATTWMVVEPLDERSFRLVPPSTGMYDVWLTTLYGVSGNNYEASAGYVFRWVVP